MSPRWPGGIQTDLSADNIKTGEGRQRCKPLENTCIYITPCNPSEYIYSKLQHSVHVYLSMEGPLVKVHQSKRTWNDPLQVSDYESFGFEQLHSVASM